MQEQGQGPQSFRFSDPRQRRIYQELNEVVGPGPAAFFRDACWLMTNPHELQSTSHLVGHLLREIESAIRQVFRPVAGNSAGAAADGSSQKEEIRAILRSLAIPENSSEARAWFKLAENLNSVAHRRGLDIPRPVDEIREIWDLSQSLLDVLLRALRERFLSWIQILDKLVAKSQPTRKDLRRLAQEVPNNRIVRQYFFYKLENPAWLEPLRARGFFKQPPKPQYKDEEGTVRFPPWPEAKYLVRMARHKPKLVAEIIQQMDDTDNAAVLSDLIEALLAMPPDVAASLVEKAQRWAECPYLLPEKMGQLISYLAKGGKTQEAMAIARVVLEILPDPRQQRASDDPYHPLPEPQARFDTWHYKQILENYYPDLVQEAALPALDLLCDLLDKAIRLSLRQEEKGAGDYSCIWRPAIEEHPQNMLHTIKDPLVSAVRDAAESLVRSGAASLEQVLDVLERRPWKVFRRIALHVLRMFANQANELVAARLTDRSLFGDVDLRHEYVLLLRDCFQRLPSTYQAKILGWIEEGREVDQWKQWQENETGRQPADEEVTRYREIWQRDWLGRIGSENLPTEWQERYRELIGKYGEPDHPQFPVYVEGGWVGPTSPKTAGQLKAMSVTQLVQFLNTWEPPQNMFREPSPEGLGRVLSDVIAEDPAPFATQASAFKNLDPTYVRALVSGLRAALKHGRPFPWEPVLDLCQWVLSQPREIPNRQVQDMHADPDWGQTRKAIADLLSAGFENSQSGIPIDLRQKVWAILKPLTADPDPTPEHEQRYGGSNMDPATLSMNTTRGEAMHAVLRYALWVRRNMERAPDAGERLQRGFEEMPEVREVLESHLDPAREPSLAVRAVYGQWFPWLVLLDPDWARTHAARIFPLDQESEPYFEAAWNTYITLCRPYNDVLQILRPQYRHAVDRIGARRNDTRWLADPDQQLATHLMAFYWSGKLSLDDPLLQAFWDKAPDALRAHALAFVGRALKQTQGNIPAETLERLKELWIRRLAAAKQAQRPSDFENEIAAFGWWFVSGKLDIDWALDQLLDSLELVRRAEPTYMTFEQLSQTVRTHPLKSVKCLKLVAECDRQGLELYASRDHVRTILQRALQDPTARQEAEKAVHYLGSRGFVQFRDLLSR